MGPETLSHMEYELTDDFKGTLQLKKFESQLIRKLKEDKKAK